MILNDVLKNKSLNEINLITKRCKIFFQNISFIAVINKYFILVFFIAVIFTACIDPPQFSEVPEITNITASKYQLQSGVDTFQLKIDFQDGDGDIGLDSDSTENNLFLVDSRTAFQYAFTIPQIPENGNIKDISGNMTINMFPLTCLPTAGDTDSIYFDVQIFDNKDNASNVFTSPLFLIDCN